MASLLAIARAASEDAKRVGRRGFVLDLLALGTGVAALLVSATGAYWLAVITLSARLTSWLVRRNASGIQTRAERLRRRGLLLDSIGLGMEPYDVVEMKRTADPRWAEAASAYEDPKYYASELPPGPGRLLENLRESAFYSRDLLSAAAYRSLGQVGVALGVCALALFMITSIPDSDLRIVLARGLILVLGSAWLFAQIERAFLWHDAVGQVEQIDRRLSQADPLGLEPALAIYADYSSTVASVPAIPTDLYWSRRSKLEQLWREGGKRLGEG